MRRLVALAFLSSFVGCTLYFDDDDDCEGWGAADIAPAQELRDPFTGECQPIGGGGWCDTSCGPCPLAEPAAQPDWGSCFSACEGLDEGTCAGTSGCRVAYLRENIGDGTPKFFGCWAIAPSGPVPGSCEGLDAQSCSQHDNCAGLYGEGIEGGTFFEKCFAESNIGCSAVDCGPGFHCEQQCAPCDAPGGGGTCPPECQPMCVPDNNACENVGCPPNSVCVEVCEPPPPGCDPGTPGTCHAECQPVETCEASATEAECVSKAGCTPVYIGDDCTCTPAGCTCEIQTYDRCETK